MISRWPRAVRFDNAVARRVTSAQFTSIDRHAGNESSREQFGLRPTKALQAFAQIPRNQRFNITCSRFPLVGYSAETTYACQARLVT
jgi:hypothetical protein